MTDDYPTTIIIRRPSRVVTDSQGRTVWQGAVEETELELMSSQTLQVAIAAAGAKESESIQAVVRGDEDGIVVRECATGLFRVISEAELLAASEKASQVKAGEDDEGISMDGLSLVSTQMFREMLAQIDVKEATPSEKRNKGFNPYDRG